MKQGNEPSPGDKLRRAAIALFLLLAAVLAILFAKPDVPSRITLFAGPKGTTFFQDGKRYRDVLARHGVTVELVATEGSMENLQRLVANCGACAGFAEAVAVRGNTILRVGTSRPPKSR